MALRDLFALPAVSVDASRLGWDRRVFPTLAEAIYAERTFDRLPILADALEDAGCFEERVLSHLRSPGPHVRGCWALDLVLGKS
jgi:hypothetical protein